MERSETQDVPTGNPIMAARRHRAIMELLSEAIEIGRKRRAESELASVDRNLQGASTLASEYGNEVHRVGKPDDLSPL
jgi:hypothetical protein